LDCSSLRNRNSIISLNYYTPNIAEVVSWRYLSWAYFWVSISKNFKIRWRDYPKLLL